MADNISQPESPHIVNTDPHREHRWAMFCHLSAFLGFIIPFPGMNVLAPLIIWLMQKNEMPFVKESGQEALNFQISMLIYSILAIPLCLILIGFTLLFGLLVINIILTIIAAVKASNGEKYQYPLAIHFLK